MTTRHDPGPQATMAQDDNVATTTRATPDDETDDDEFTDLHVFYKIYISISCLFHVSRVVEYQDFFQMLFTPVYQ